jgi:hypothetical protein
MSPSLEPELLRMLRFVRDEVTCVVVLVGGREIGTVLLACRVRTLALKSRQGTLCEDTLSSNLGSHL